ncbi:MAG: hypothetical protein RR473_02450 [Comamonas sp.]
MAELDTSLLKHAPQDLHGQKFHSSSFQLTPEQALPLNEIDFWFHLYPSEWANLHNLSAKDALSVTPCQTCWAMSCVHHTDLGIEVALADVLAGDNRSQHICKIHS